MLLGTYAADFDQQFSCTRSGKIDLLLRKKNQLTKWDIFSHASISTLSLPLSAKDGERLDEEKARLDNVDKAEKGENNTAATSATAANATSAEKGCNSIDINRLRVGFRGRFWDKFRSNFNTG